MTVEAFTGPDNKSGRVTVTEGILLLPCLGAAGMSLVSSPLLKYV